MLSSLRTRSALVGLALSTLAVVSMGAPSAAWIRDRNENGIDDTIERVHLLGPAAAYEKGRLAIGVTSGATGATGATGAAGTTLTYAVRVKYDHLPTALDVAALSALGVSWTRPYLYIPYIRTEATYTQIQLALALAGVTRVEAVPVIYALNHIGTRAVRARDSRGYLKKENDVLFPSARQELGLDGTGVVVAIFDTGVNDSADIATTYPGHESVRGKFLGGGEFFYGNPLLNTPNTASMNPSDHGAEASQYHATHVAGTAIGSGGPSGVFAGVAPKARVVDCKVLSDAGASLSGVPEAIEWCVFNKNKLWPGLSGADTAYRGVDVVNMSLGDVLSSDGTEADALAVNSGVRRGLVIVCASGNLGLTEYIASPSSADSSICVGATTHSKSIDRSDDLVTSFSQEGVRADDGDADHVDEMKPNVVAPGNGIISANGDPTTDGTLYKGLSGTSMASPHVAGCVALLLQADPTLTALEIRSILQNTADHNMGNEKGDRPNDPFGIDPNYDPGCGWGEVDVFAAAKEALNSTSGVQLNQMKRPVVRVQDGAIDLCWVTQREYAFQGFEVHRAPDAGGAPGTFARLNPTLVPPAGDAVIAGDDNRTSYAWTDDDPALEPGSTYWYRVAWVDGGNTPHAEPAIRAIFGESPRLATAYYNIVHDSPDGDLTIRVGASLFRDPDHAAFVTTGPGSAQQDSFQFTPADIFYFPPGHIRHFWSVGLTVEDGISPLLPPGPLNPWFLHVEEAGFADQFGQVESFSMFVNDSPNSASGTTYTTNSMTPQVTIEGMHTTLWIPALDPLAVGDAQLAALAEPGGVRLTLVLGSPPGTTAQVFRSTSGEFSTRRAMSPVLTVESGPFEYLDATAEPGVRYAYWIVVETLGTVIVNGPVFASRLGPGRATFITPMAPNPMRASGAIRYTIGADLAGAGTVPVSLDVLDAQGRRVRELERGARGTGEHLARWDGTDKSGVRAAPGLYVVRLRAGGIERTTKLSLVR